MKRTSYFFVFTMLIALLFAFVVNVNQSIAQDDDNIVIGKRVTLHSDVLGEDRVLWIYTPDGYETSTNKYPVMFVLDGGFHFHHATGAVQFLGNQGIIPPMIVVSVLNIDRNRDFLPTNVENIPTSGGADKFLEFFNDELIPHISENYRTEPYEILAGHSFGGTFAAYTILTRPETFDAYIAISPALWYDDELLVKKAETYLPGNPDLKKIFFMTLGTEGDRMQNSLDAFVQVLKDKAPAGLKWEYLSMADDDHGSTPHKSIYEGLEMIYPDWRVNYNDPDITLAGVEEHYKGLTEKYGYTVAVPEFVINILGYAQIEQGNLDEAIKIFKLNVEKFPNSANVYDSLGEGYENNGEFEEAKKYYLIAIEKGEANNDALLPYFKQHLERVQQKIDEQ